MFKAALFDCDGVVLDTEWQYSAFWGRMGRKYFPTTPGFENHIKGMTLLQIYNKYCPNDEKLQAQLTDALYDFEANMTYPYVNGFLSFVGKLRQRCVKTALVTSSNLDKMSLVYKAHPEFRGLFDEILTSEDFDRSKPDPDCYMKAAARFNLSPRECAGFEDSINGLRAVDAANMYCVGLATTNSRDVVLRYASIVIDDYSDTSISSVLAMF